MREHLEEEVKALLEKQLMAVEEATERLKTSHQQEMKDLMEKHQQEVGLQTKEMSLLLQIYHGVHF